MNTGITMSSWLVGEAETITSNSILHFAEKPTD
jgi:hypothetical protein